MDWKYRWKRRFGNRYALTAALFLCILAWGAATCLTGALELQSGCAGYARPQAQAGWVKGDPSRPRRSPAGAPASALNRAGSAVSWADQLRDKAAQAETLAAKALENDRGLIQLFGAFQRFADRTVVEDAVEPQYAVVRLSDGSLSFVGQGEPDAQVQAAELKRLKTFLDERDISLLYLQAPSKLTPGETVLPYGVEDTSNACADRLLAALEEAGVDALDLRAVLQEAGGDWTDWFYQTDHHWTQEAAFTAFQAVAERLETYRQSVKVGEGVKRRDIVIPERYTDPDSYARETLSGWFLGSQGKRVGSLYAGTDDFELWTPKFPTNLHYSISTAPDRYGALEDSVLFSQRVEEKDLFGANPYTYYAGGDYAFTQITNYYNPQGPRVLLIRDSFACALTPYLALASSQLTTIDPRYFSSDLADTLEWVRPDVVVVLYSSGMVRSEQYYRLLSQPAGPSKADSMRWLED